ncbi:MAG: molybdopterin-dependent oxidoreductase [Syntrophales bacterium]|nr:molybdopterin-dependent oxidoreductase [Syntrophales bacterium]
MAKEVKKAVCYWCHCHCKVDVHIEKGKLVKVAGVTGEPRSERVQRVVNACPRAKAVTEYFYHPDRLCFPLKRAGERGEGKWEQVSWEQALDEVAEKLDGLRKKYGPETLTCTSGTYRTADEYRSRFLNLFGTPNNIGQGPMCYGPGIMGVALLGWWIDFGGFGKSTGCLVIWGSNPKEAYRNVWFATQDHLKRKGKLIVIDPRRTDDAEKADIWLQPRPGTDAALALGMVNVVIEEGLYDKEFVDKWCHGFDELAQRAAGYPLSKVEEITWVPKEKIRDAAVMYATTKPSFIFHSMGLEQLANSMEAYHARTSLAAITGNFDVRGGEELREGHPQVVSEYEIELNNIISPEQKKKQIEGDRFKLGSFVGYDLVMGKYAKSPVGKAHVAFAHPPSVYRTMITGEPYPIKAMFTVSSNPLVTQANAKLVYRAIKSLDLFVVTEMWKTPTAELADYIFPIACWLERPQLHTWSDTFGFIDCGVAAMPGQVEGKYDRRADYDFWRGLGVRLGQEEYWPWKTLEEAFDYRLTKMGLTFREFIEKKEGFTTWPKEEKKYEKNGFGTPSKKVELYSNILKELGYDPLPQFYEPAESPYSRPDLAEKYPLILITGGRHMPFYHSEHRQISSLRRQHPHPIVQIHPETAAGLGIEDGDWAWIETERGRVRQKCKYFDGIDPRVIHGQHGWWFPEMPGEEPWLHGVWESNINVVVDDHPDHCNRINGAWPLRTALCKIYKAIGY